MQETSKRMMFYVSSGTYRNSGKEYINTLERELYDLRKYVLELEEEMK